MIGRSAIREHVFVLLFESLFNSSGEMEAQSANYFDGLEKPVDDESISYIEQRFHSVEEHLSEIDALIEEKSTGWKIGRIGKVELSIIRLAVYEILFDDDVPVSVAINEAVELSKKYGQDQAGAFVNGVLAKFADMSGKDKSPDASSGD